MQDAAMNDAPDHITLDCEHCGRRIRVASSYAVRHVPCPACKGLVLVPDLEPGKSRWPFNDALLDIAPETMTPDTAEVYRQMLEDRRGPWSRSEKPPSRKLPWIIDIFLYPCNASGWTLLLLAVGVPFLLRCLTKFFLLTTTIFPPALVFLIGTLFLHWIVLVLFLLTMNWYMCACISDSSEGGLRAPDTIAIAPSLPEILLQTLRLLLCVLVVFAPALFYLERLHVTDRIFWGLCSLGVIAWPMAILSVVKHESIGGLNPWLLFRSVLKTLFRYLPLVLFCYLPWVTLILAGYILIKHWPWGYAFLLLAYYQLLILGHLLGRFYWHVEEKLYWTV
jgi:hypothetical protein